MKEFRAKVAVITGAASGIGRAIAELAAREGMKVVLADVEESALNDAERGLKATGATVLAVRTDVSKVGDVQTLAQKTFDAFGEVHLLFNNAGVAGGGTIWESTLEDWQWVMGVNLWGVIYGLRAFVPKMLLQDTECHIVNTASVAGLLTGHPGAPYCVTKHGVVALSENLYHSLAQQTSKVKVSVLCPGWVNTRIPDSARNRPSELLGEPGKEPISPEIEALRQQMRQAILEGMPPRQIADHVFEAIKAEQFYILTHPEFTPRIQQRFDNILQSRNPSQPET